MKKKSFTKRIPLILLLVLSACSSLPGKNTVEQITQNRAVALQLMDQGNGQFDKALYETALQSYQTALYLYSGIDFEKGTIQALLSISRCRQALAENEKALISMNLALSWAERSGNALQIRNVRNHLADYYIKNGNLETALQHCMEDTGFSFEIPDEVNSERLRLLGTIRKKEKDYPGALDYYQQALALDEELKSFSDLALDHYLISSIYSLQGSYPQSIQSLQEALSKDRYIEYIPGVASDLTALAVVYAKSGDQDTSLFYYRKAYLAWKGLNRITEMDEIQKKIEQITGEEFFSP